MSDKQYHSGSFNTPEPHFSNPQEVRSPVFPSFSSASFASSDWLEGQNTLSFARSGSVSANGAAQNGAAQNSASLADGDDILEFHSTRSPFVARAGAGRPEMEPASRMMARQELVRQEELDHRENQLNARMAQFETLVRNTKLSLQAKMEEVSQRENQLKETESILQAQKLSLNEVIDGEKRDLENQQLEIQHRKADIEERLARRERELLELAGERERELTARVEDYRQQLETKLHECKSDYQSRYEKKCKEIETEFMQRLVAEKSQLDLQQQKNTEDFEARILRLDREVEAKKAELETKYATRLEELDRQLELRKKEVDDSGERRVKRLSDEYAQKKQEMETRLDRREEQVRRRESMIQQAEEEWNRRRETFESQWNDFDMLRKTKSDELARRESKLEERDHFLIEFEAKLKKKEMEQAAVDEAIKARECQIALDAQKYAALQQMEIEVVESQAEASRMREALVRERHQLQKNMESERRRLRETQELTLRRLEEERQDLTQQNKRIEQMRLALDRSRDELGRMHRETLEIRLATEELWLRLSGETSSEDLKESICKIRTRLADQYQEAAARLATQKDELKMTRDQMMQQHEKLLARREELDTWAKNCESALADRERALKDRETELERRQATVDETQRRTLRDRAEMEKEVKLLQEQIDRALDKRAA